MTFKDIKVGDKVLVKSKVKTGWVSSESFWIPKIVDRVTPKQFVVGMTRYKKENGACIGDRYEEGVKIIGSRKDEIKKRNIIVKRVNAAYNVKNIIDQFIISYDHKKLYEILSKLEEAEKLLINF